MVKSADRVMEVLEWLAEVREPATHAEIAAHLRIPGSSTSALLADMLRRGYLLVDDQRRYRMGPAVMRLASAFMAELDLPRAVEPEVTALASHLRETVGFAVRVRAEMLVVSRCTWPNQLTYVLQIGDRAPLGTSASGRALLGRLPPGDRPRLPVAQASAVEAAAANGIAFSWAELIVGINTAAVAVLDASGDAAGALSVSVPTPRYDPPVFRRYCALLVEAATRLSRRLGAAGGVEVDLETIVLRGEATATAPRLTA
ncbi:IclR family transcriptional regulator [Falsiroseomonas sp. E2-1-a4]|uniref:IclR family transcriptional regulator n=1 Tax=Falsiroseomonas sp. E2-1-a4 TaxID=3239299 RepID=UPI003F3CC3BA